MRTLKLQFLRKNFFTGLFLLGSFITTNTYAQVDLNNGLVAYLPMNGNGIDQSGNNNNASNDAGSTQTYIGVDRNMNFAKCMRFIGDNGKAEMTFGAPLLSNRNAWTVSLWVDLSSGADAMNIFGQDNIFEITYYITGANRFVLYHPTSGSVDINLVSPFYNNWRHLLVTGDNTGLKVYLNGVLTVNLAGDYTLGNNTNNTNIGGHVINQTSTTWLKGQIDDIRIYSRVVTDDEIAALSNQNLPEIAINNVSNTTFCAGEDVTVDFTTTGNIEADNIYSLQLSQPDGTFDAPIILDSVLSNSITGTFISTIPTGVFSGTNYRLRVTSSNLSATSDTTSALTINSVLGNIPSNSAYIFVGNINGRNYYKSTATSGGGTANTTANSNGGYLATVYDYATNQLLYYNSRDSRQYIGLNDLVQEGVYVWRDNSSPVYTNWASAQPDNSGNEDYTEIRGDNGQWNDLSNTSSKTHFMQLAPAGFDHSFCLGDDLPLTAVSLAGATYNWTGPDSFTSTNQNPLISGAQSQNAGTYTVTYTLGACSASTSVQIGMNPLPANSLVTIQADSICPNTSATFIIQNTDATIMYQLRDALNNPIGAAQTGNGGILSFDTGLLTVTSDFNFLYNFTATSCSSVSNVLTVHVRTTPTAPTTTGDEICNGGSMTVSATGAVGTGFYNWYNSATGGSPINGLTGSTLTIDTNVTQTYYISITDNYGCESMRTPVLANVINPLNSPVDLISDLILYYKFDGDLNDYSGNDYNGSVNGTNSYVNDHNSNANSAINSTSTSTPGGNYISAGNPTKIQQLTNQISISMWIRQTQTWFGSDGFDGQMPLINKWDGSTGLWVGLHMVNPSNMTNRIRWRINGSTYLESNTNVPINGWHHIVCTYNGSQLKIYQNGILTGSKNYTGTIPNTFVSLLLGKQANGTPSGGITYRGYWDEVKIYNRALNLSEVQTLHNDESVAFENTPFCDGEGNLELTTLSFPGATYQWTGPNGFSSTDQNPTIIMNADSATYAGLYTLQVTTNGCTSPVQSADVIIHQLPSATVNVENDSICLQSSTNFYFLNTDVAMSYQLQDSAGNSIGSPQVGNGDTLFFNTGVLDSTTQFQFYYEYTATGCSSMSDTQTIFVRNIPSVPITTNDTICNGGSMTVSATGAVGTGYYNWYNSATGGSPINGLTGSTLTIDTNITQTYYISITDDYGCESERSEVVAYVQNSLNQTVNLSDGLIMYYDFNNNFTDQTGNTSLGTTNGSASVADYQGNPNAAKNLTNDSYYIFGNPGVVQQLNNQVTISMWVNQTAGNWGLNTPLLNKWQGNGLYLGLNSYGVTHENRVLWMVNNSASVNSSVNVPHGVWHNILVTYDGAMLKVYQNGQLTGQTAYVGTITNTISDLEFGHTANAGWGNGTIYEGSVDEIRMYKRALSADEIATLYNDESVAFENSPLCDGQGNLELTTLNFPGATYQWTGPNGFSSTDQNPTIIMNADSATYAGLYTLQVTTNGCTSPVQSADVIIHQLPSAPSVINDTVCTSGNATLTANGAPSGGGYAWYTVSSGGTPIAGETSSTLTINNLLSTTTYYVAIVRNGCEGNRTAVTAVYINAVQSNLTVTGSSLCLGETTANVTVDASETGVMYQAFLGTNPISAQLSGGGTLVIPVNTTTMSTGDNTVTIQANYPSCGSITLTNTATVTINALPTATINASGPINFCQGGSVDLTASTANSYVWNTTETTSSITIANSGSYSVIVTDANGCKDTSAITTVAVDQIPTPLLDTIGQTTFCQGGDVTFNVSGGASYLWNTTETGNTITVNQTGTYNVIVTSGACSVTSQDILVTVNSSPSVVANASENAVCSGETTILTGSGANAYSWDNGVTDGVAFTPSSTNYTVTGTDLNGCEATDAITITVNPLPDATFLSSSITFCPGATSLTLTANDPNLSNYDWYLDGSPLQLNGTNTQNITTTGDYQLTTTDNNGCSNNFTQTINAGTAPQVVLSVNDTAFCSNETELITADLITNANYVWIQDGSSVTGSVLEGNSYAANSAGEYSVQVVNSDGCTGTSDTITLTTITAPTATITATNTSLCSGDSVVISANLIGGAMYEWYLDGSSLGAAQLEQNTWYASATGDYSVIITTTCSTTSNLITVTQANLPNAASAINGNTLFCAGISDIYTTNAVTGATNYYWEVIPANAATIGAGQGTTSVTINTTNQNFTLKVTPQNDCGNGTASTLSIALGDPQFDCAFGIYFYANETNVCEGATVIFTDASTINNPGLIPHWDFGVGANPASAVGSGPFSVTYSTSGSKTVVLTYEDTFGNPFYDETKTNYIIVAGSVSTSSISGNTSLTCNAPNETYSVVNTSGSTYQWTVPVGATIISGQGTNSITVNFNGNAGTINVQETNTTGCTGGLVSLSVSINNTVNTSSISGNEEVKCNSSSEIYSVVNTVGSTYQWTIPIGATIISGQGTNSIAINFNGNFGTVSVVETNSDGCVGISQTIQVSCSHVGIDEYTQSENVQVYPNPATQNFQVDFDNKDGGQLYLYSSDGRIVKQTTVFSQQIIDIEMLEPAVYIGKIIFSNNRIYLFRLVKQ